jgi:uncharacterized repeat protein (TIGR03803 family)
LLLSLTNCADGEYPSAGLIFDQVGNLYGTTEGGDHSNVSMAFELTPNADGSWAEKVLHSFPSGSGDGWDLRSGLIFDGSGNLYGTTFHGGKQGAGTVFKLAPNMDGSWTESLLHRFNYARAGAGTNPYGSLIFDAAGNLYGSTLFGGAFNYCYGGCGTVFELSPNADGSWKHKVLHQFVGRDGYGPYAGVTFDQAGNLYGTTWLGGDLTCGGFTGGCGVVFKLAANSNGIWKESVPHRFIDRPGAQSVAGVAFDAAGNLYGTTEGDGITTFGSVFEIMP